MNERIKELMIQCEKKYCQDHDDYFYDMEKFAELIIRECCEVAHCNFHVDGLTLGGILKEHFGVENGS